MGVGAVVLATAITFAVVVGNGEAAHATSTTSAAATGLPTGAVSPNPRRVWSTDDQPAVGDPLWVGTVITWSAHQLSGRDAATGAVRWSYRRTDLRICQAGQADGRAYVLFAQGPDCDELSTFDASTGARGWFRTMADNGAGRLLFSSGNLVVVYPTSVHAVYAPSGVDRFPSYAEPANCSITGAAPGSAGVLITQSCPDGAHLLLHAYTDKNQPVWRVPVDAGVRAVAADQPLITYDGASRQLQVRSATGDVTTTPTPTLPGSFGSAVLAGSTTVIGTTAQLTALTATGAAPWAAVATGPATLADAAGSTVLAPTATGAVRLRVDTGEVAAAYSFSTSPAKAAAADTRVFAAGNGLLLAGTTLTYLR